MQRVTRLLSGTSSRARWRIPAALAIVLVSGGLLATQVGITGQKKSGLHIRSTTDGVLGPGDMREVTANGLDGERYYRVSVDAQGQLIELYKRDGKAQPITANVRTWISEVDRLSVPPIPPMPPMPPMPSMPPMPPAPPPPPEVAESAVFKSLLRAVAADPGVIAKLGSPVVLADNEVGGYINVDDAGVHAGADVDVSFALRGSKGRADVQVDGQFDDGQWSLAPVVFESAVR